MAFIGKAEFLHDFIDTHVSVQEAAFYQLHLVVQDVLLHGFIGLLLEVTP